MTEHANAAAGMSRRTFLGGLGATALGASMLSAGLLTGCSPAKSTATSAANDAAGAQTASATGWTGTSPYAQINPTDWEFTNNSIKDLSSTKMAEEGSIGSVTMKNRFLKSAATSGVANDEQQAVAYFSNIAKGGIGGVFVEGSYIMCDEIEGKHSTSIFGPESRLSIDQSPLKAIAAEIHAQGVPAFVQLKWGTPGIVYTWSNTPATGTETKASELSIEDIEMFVADTATAAKKLQSIGYDGIEINAAGDNIPAWFLTRIRNDRPVDDPYGPATFENRTRFLCEMIAAVKDACGSDFPVQIRMNGVEENDSPLGQSALASSVEDVCEMAKILEKAGADSFHVILGTIENHEAQFLGDGFFGGYGLNGTNGFGYFFDFERHFGGYVDGKHSGCGLLLDVTAKLKEAVSVPVGSATYMDPAIAPDMFDAAFNEGKIDFLFINRPIGNADPEYPTKFFENRIEDIRPCCRCLHCAADFNNHMGLMEACRVNPCKARAFTEAMPEGYEPPAGDGNKNVMVVGGGPAGMEAARVCAERGYTVSLYEKSGALGGLLSFAELVKGEHENLGRLKDYMSHALEAAGVNVVTGKEVDADFVRSEKPDVVIVATGGVRPESKFQSKGATTVVSISDFLAGEVGQNVVIAGFNAQAFDCAQYIMSFGKSVTMVAADPEAALGKGQSDKMLMFTKPGFYSAGGRAYDGAEIVAVNDGSVTVKTASGAEVEIACDTLVDASDMEKNTQLTDALGSDFKVYAVGDCADPWDIQNSIAMGNLAARAC